MATAVGNTNQTYWSLRLEVWEDGYSTSDNTSTVRWEIYLDANGGSVSGRQLYRKAVVNGVTVIDDTSAVSVSSYGSALLGSGSLTVPHDTDGTKIISASAEIAQSGSWSHSIGNASCALNLSLTTIARASIPSINTWPNNTPDFTLGATIVIHMNRKSVDYVHDVRFNYGNTYRVIASNVTDNVSFNTSLVSNNILALCTDKKFYINTVQVITKDSQGNIIGTAECAYKANLDEATYKPVITSVTVSDGNSVTSALSDNLIDNASTLRLTINMRTAENTATLSKLKLFYGSIVQVENLSGTSDSYTLVVPNVNFNQVNYTVVDSRGFETSGVKTWTSIHYVPPTVNITAKRSTSDPTKITINLSGQGFAGTFRSQSYNSFTVTLYIASTGSSATTETLTPLARSNFSGTSYNYQTTASATFQSGAQYTIYVVVQDLITSATSISVTIYQALPIVCVFPDKWCAYKPVHVHNENTPSQFAVYKHDSILLTDGTNNGEIEAGSNNTINIKKLRHGGKLMPVFATGTGTITVPSNNGGDVTITLNQAMPNTSYVTTITRYGNPNGFDQVSYDVDSQTTTTVTIHGWNSYSATVTQQLKVTCVGWL